MSLVALTLSLAAFPPARASAASPCPDLLQDPPRCEQGGRRFPDCGEAPGESLAAMLRLGLIDVDPSTGRLYTAVGGDQEDHRTWSWYKAPPFSDLRAWCSAEGWPLDRHVAEPPGVRPKAPAFIRCLDGTSGGVDYRRYPRCTAATADLADWARSLGKGLVAGAAAKNENGPAAGTRRRSAYPTEASGDAGLRDAAAARLPGAPAVGAAGKAESHAESRSTSGPSRDRSETGPRSFAASGGAATSTRRTGTAPSPAVGAPVASGAGASGAAPSGESGGAYVFNLPGEFLVSGPENHNWQYDMKFPEVKTFGSVRVEFDFFAGPWDPAKPNGHHCLMWLNMGRKWSNMFGYINALGGGKNKTRLSSNFGGGPAAVNGGKTVKPGGTYHMKYEYNGLLGKVWYEISKPDGTVLVARALSREVGTFSSKWHRIQFGTQIAKEGPEAKTYGWKFSNLRVQFLPASPVAPPIDPPSPPPVEPPGDGAALFTLPGEFLVSGPENHNWQYDMKFPEVKTFGSVKVEFDVVAGPWDPANPGGTHCLMWLNQGRSWSDMFGYINALGGGKNRTKLSSNFGGGGAGVISSKTLEPGGTYHLKYEYNGLLGKVGYEISRPGGSVLVAGSLPRAVGTFSTNWHRIQFGTQIAESGPEARTYGWRFSNLRAEFVP